jgi:hypothetical protein
MSGKKGGKSGGKGDGNLIPGSGKLRNKSGINYLWAVAIGEDAS